MYWKLVFSAEHTVLEAPDFANQVMPWLDLQARALRQGEIALWDPYLLGGQPLAAQMQPGVTNPLTYLLLAAPLRNGHLDPIWVHRWLVFLHLLAGLFAYLLARGRHLSGWPAIAVGLVFAAGGYPGHTHWPQHLSGMLWMPLVALFLLRTVEDRAASALRAAAAAGLFLGLCWLSGHPQIPLLVTLAAVSTLLIAKRRAALVPLAVLLGVTALVSAVSWLPAIEYGRHAVRWVDLPEPYAWNQRIPHHVHERNALPAASLPHFLIPGEPHSLANPFTGGVAMLLAATGLLVLRRAARWWALAALAGLVFALARDNPFHGILYSLVPMLDKARTPSAALAITQLGIAMLAGLGLSSLPDRAPRWLGAAAAAAGLVTLAAVLFEPAALMRIPQGPDRLALSAFLWLLAGTAVAWRAGGSGAAVSLVLLAVFELSASVGYDFRRFDDRSRPSIWRRLDTETAPLAASLRRQMGDRRTALRYNDVLFNFGDWHGIETLDGYLPGVLAANHALGWWEPRVLDLYSVGYTVSAGTPGGPLQLTGREGALPRAWSVHRIAKAPSMREAASMIIDGRINPRETAVVTEGGALQLETCTGEDRVRVVERSGLHHLRVEARMACRGLVIVNDNHYPGWQATVDGRPAPILTVDAALRAVKVEAGLHEVSFAFRPSSVYWGAALSLAGLALGFWLMIRPSAAPPESAL